MKKMPDTQESPLVFVDALNVARSTWPNIPAHRFVSLCEKWAEKNGHPMVVVFDGSAPRDDGRSAESPLRLIGTGAETADRWIEREAARLASEGAPYWLVSSDRELRDLAGRLAQRTIGGGTFARELIALETPSSNPG